MKRDMGISIICAITNLLCVSLHATHPQAFPLWLKLSSAFLAAWFVARVIYLGWIAK